ncbi:hypothetical protein NLI96_g3306 [Meripilus lineatus]|uniref:Uncharacterized protein n=1 Tax=Meripilus lineatus TaxID=2056292 RepID=A0AAD5V8E1_9APHY|nr:hypothetical protein NLI96_g3306 [Physisporinus lineatus]
MNCDSPLTPTRGGGRRSRGRGRPDSAFRSVELDKLDTPLSPKHSELPASPHPNSLVALYLDQMVNPTLEAALFESLTTGQFYDTKLYAFSRKDPSGVVNTPVGIFASSSILKEHSVYFKHLLKGGFSESAKSDLYGEFPADRQPYNEHYSYGEDSDIEDDYTGLPMIGSSVSGDLKPEKDTNDTRSTPQDRSTSPSTAVEIKNKDVVLPDLILPSNSSANLTSGLRGNVIVKPDVAFNTLRALIFWFMTGKIAFAPLRSEGTTAPNDGPRSCSPKSMYRLASELDIDKLKELAIEDIKNKLSSKNILPELFSEFSSLYPEVLAMEINYIQTRADKKILREQFTSWSKDILAGNFPHAVPALLALTESLLPRA